MNSIETLSETTIETVWVWDWEGKQREGGKERDMVKDNESLWPYPFGTRVIMWSEKFRPQVWGDQATRKFQLTTRINMLCVA